MPSSSKWKLAECRAGRQNRGMPTSFSRRGFLAALAGGPLAAGVGCRTLRDSTSAPPRLPRLFFTSQGRTALLHADGAGLRNLHFEVPNQASWQPAGFFSDGRRVLFLGIEPQRDGPGRPFEEYYTQTALVAADLGSAGSASHPNPTQETGRPSWQRRRPTRKRGAGLGRVVRMGG